MDNAPNRATNPAIDLLPISWVHLGSILVLLGALYYASLHNFLLFHSLVELFSILVFFGIFVIAWNARRIINNHYLLFLGIGFLFVGIIDLEHTLAYKGMEILGHEGSANHATQLWIAARLTQGLALLISPFWLQRRFRPYLVFSGFFVWSLLLLWAIHAGFFPECFIEGSGLTPFKKVSEYVISSILVAGYLVLRRRRHLMDVTIFRLMAASIFFTIASELAFTSYISVFGVSNILGHFAKFIAAYFIYMALVETGLKAPYSLLFRELATNQEILTDREAEFRSMFETSAMGMAKLDPFSNRFLRVNQKLCQITGYSETELTRLNSTEITYPEDRERDREAFDKYLFGQVPIYKIEKRYVRKDGEIIWVRVTSGMIRSEDGRPLHSIGIIEDITAWRRDQELLRQSEQKFRQITQSVKDVIWMSTPGIGKILYVNQAYEKLWGRSRESLYRDPLSFREAVHPEDLPQLDGAQLLHAEGIWQFVYRIVRPDGSIRWIEDSGSPIYGENGSIHMMVGVARDITTRKLLEEQHQRRKEELEKEVSHRTAELANTVEQLRYLTLQLSEAENRERRRLAEILHDDLQQLLAAANMHLDRLKGSMTIDSQRSRMEIIIDILQRAIKTSRSLSHDLSPPILYRGSLNAILEWLAARKLANYDLSVKVTMPDNLRIESDILRVFLLRALQELLFNIVKHAGTNEATITIKPQEEETLLITVADRGRGFDPQALSSGHDRITDAGFGLFSIRERLHLLGGSLTIYSKPGHGSSFVICLPLRETTAVRLQQKREFSQKPAPLLSIKAPAATIDPPSERPPIRVLLADDHETIRQGLLALLKEEEDIKVVGQASNGIEAVKLTGERQPDVVIMDLGMPEMDGIEATEEIVRQWPEVVVIAHSMHEDRELADTSRAAGARAYCAKSGGTGQLLAAIRRHGRKGL